jgi:CBS domain containing-hemolysin-like protein
MSWFALQLVLICVLVFITGIFSATEMAYTGLTLAQIKRINRAQPGALALWEKHPDQVLATLLLSNNSVNIAIGVIAASMAADAAKALNWRNSILTVLFSLLSGTFVLIFGEIVPKILARQLSVPWAVRITPIMTAWTALVNPFAKMATRLTNWLLIFYRKRRPASLFLQKRELDTLLRHSVLPFQAKNLLNNVLDFSRSTAKDIMIPRSDIFAVSLDTPIEKLIRMVLVSGYSRIPVFSGGFNRMIGVLYAKDLLVSWRSGSLVVLEDLIRPIHLVAPDMPLPEIFRVFKTGHHHLALVRREGIETPIEGMITLQDALETIVGEITEEV